MPQPIGLSRELNCLNRIVELIQDEPPQEALLEGVLDLLPEVFKYPEAL